MRLGGHAAPKGLPTCKESNVGDKRGDLDHGGTHGPLGKFGRIWALGALLHIRKLIAQGVDAALGKSASQVRQKRVPHARPGPMGQHVARASV